jgi:uroporphyrinogen decarboxylase
MKTEFKQFQPDWQNFQACAYNKKPKRVPLYDHSVHPHIIERITGKQFAAFQSGSAKQTDAFYKNFCGFFAEYGYDAMPFEMGVVGILPNGGALTHPQTGYIDSAEKFDTYPFDSVPDIYIKAYKPQFEALKANMPEGLKAVGGVGNGVFEIVQDLTGYENLCIMMYDEPEIFQEIFSRVGNMMYKIWEWTLGEYGDLFCVSRFGDDLGYKQNTLLPPDTIIKNIIPQYRRISELIHKYNKPFLLHSCGCIFEVMDSIINEAQIDAKHSNEDAIADFSVWVERYGSRIANFGGIDTDKLVRAPEDELIKAVDKVYSLAQAKDGGLGIGSGNSIPDYVDEKKYLLMINRVRELRGDA